MLEEWVAVFMAFGFPAAIVLAGIAYAAFQRYLKHKEWMAMIQQGMVPEDLESKFAREWKASTGSAVTITLIGIAITIGLLTIGIGPWLIGGLVPTAIGCGLLISQLLGESKDKKNKKDE